MSRIGLGRRRRSFLATLAVLALASLAATASAGGAGASSRPTSGVARPSAAVKPADRFGVAVGGAIQDEDDATLRRDLDTYGGMGARWIRFDVNWAVIQRRGPESYDWRPFDRVVVAARARGFAALGTILYTPSWARPAGAGATWAPDPARYAAFAGAAARHYAALGVHAYEIWNEPNITAFWKPRPSASRYAELLERASAAIRSADPRAIVLTGGTSPAASDGANVAPVDFLKGIYAAGAKASFDAVAHHPYSWPADPGDPSRWSAWYQMVGASPSLRSVMRANGDAAKKIWATEFGAPTNGPSGSFVGEAAQSRMLAKAYSLFASYSWAGPLFWYSGRDLGTSTDTRENFFGVVRNDFSPKPSFTAYRRAAAAAR
jgi:polysaccharide biosynthesis protein PslG